MIPISRPCALSRVTGYWLLPRRLGCGVPRGNACVDAHNGGPRRQDGRHFVHTLIFTDTTKASFMMQLRLKKNMNLVGGSLSWSLVRVIRLTFADGDCTFEAKEAGTQRAARAPFSGPPCPLACDCRTHPAVLYSTVQYLSSLRLRLTSALLDSSQLQQKASA